MATPTSPSSSATWLRSVTSSAPAVPTVRTSSRRWRASPRRGPRSPPRAARWPTHAPPTSRSWASRRRRLTADTPPVAALPLDAPAAATDAAASNPSVLIAAADVDVAEAELRAARASYLPRLDAELSASAADDAGGIQGEDVGASALLVLRYNLFRHSPDIAREREVFHRANQSRAELARPRRQAAEESRLSYNALETARARAAACGRRPRRSDGRAMPMPGSSSWACATCSTCSTPRTSCSTRGWRSPPPSTPNCLRSIAALRLPVPCWMPSRWRRRARHAATGPGTASRELYPPLTLCAARRAAR